MLKLETIIGGQMFLFILFSCHFHPEIGTSMTRRKQYHWMWFRSSCLSKVRSEWISASLPEYHNTQQIGVHQTQLLIQLNNYGCLVVQIYFLGISYLWWASLIESLRTAYIFREESAKSFNRSKNQTKLDCRRCRHKFQSTAGSFLWVCTAS